MSTGVEVHLNTRIGNEEGDIPFEKLREEFDAVYIAIGAHTDKKIGIEGEDSHGVISAVEMLRNIGEEKCLTLRIKPLLLSAAATLLWTAPAAPSVSVPKGYHRLPPSSG